MSEVLAAIELDDAGARNALAEVFVRRADDHLLDAPSSSRARPPRWPGRRPPRARPSATPRRQGRPAPPRAARPGTTGRGRCPRRSCSPATARCGMTRSRGRSRRRHGWRRPPAAGAPNRATPRTARHLVTGRVAMRRCAEEVAEQLVGPVDEVHLHGETESVTEEGGACVATLRRRRARSWSGSAGGT